MAGSADYYWYRSTLNISEATDVFNGINWSVLFSVLILAWIIIYYAMMNGSEQAGPKLYFIAISPYVVLFIFLIMGLTGDGGQEGLYILLKPDWNLL